MPRKRRSSKKRSKRGGNCGSEHGGGRRMRGGGLFSAIADAAGAAKNQLGTAMTEAVAGLNRAKDKVGAAGSTLKDGFSKTGENIGDRYNMATTGKSTEQLNKEKEDTERAAASAAALASPAAFFNCAVAELHAPVNESNKPPPRILRPPS